MSHAHHRHPPCVRGPGASGGGMAHPAHAKARALRPAAWRAVLLAGVLALAGALATPVHAARLALVIGNDQYPQLKRPLRNAGNDAELMAATLQRAGFDVVGGVRRNLGRSAMWRAINEVKGRIGENDEVVFFFAGHGVQIGANQLLLPSDIEADSADQVDTDALRLLDVHDRLRGARFALLIIDACRDNPFPPRAGLRTIGDTRGLVLPAREQLATGTAIFMAASTGQKALDSVPGNGVASGLFTHELVQALQTPGLDVISALRQARDAVEDKAKAVNHAQRPALVEEMRGGWALFAGPQRVEARGPTAAEVELQAWQAAQRGHTLAGYDAYMAEYPQGSYASAARVARAVLQPGPRAAPVVQQPVGAPNSRDRIEAEAWALCRNGTTRAPCDDYLRDWPRGNYALLAGTRLRDIDAAQRAEPARTAGAALGQPAPVSDAEVRAAYDAYRTSQIEYRARHILSDTAQEASALIAQIKAGASFEELAKRESRDRGSAPNGGDLDFARADAYVPEFGQAMSKLRVGETTATPVKSQFGWHVIRLDDKRPPALPTFEEVKDRIRERLQEDRLRR